MSKRLKRAKDRAEDRTRTSGDTLHLCKQCDVVYDYNDEWSHCPRCGVELNEAEIA